jgi:cell division septation protein DedD
MITVDKYIRKLLFEHDCVIIPEFGGLLTHHVGAHYDAIQGVFLPARKRLAFNEVLKIDDGLLTYYVAAHEKLSREDALGVVKRYVDAIRQELQSGGTLEMESVGVFAMNAEGKLVFEPDYAQNYNMESFGMQSLAVREVVRDDVYTGLDDLVLDSEMEFVSGSEPAARRHSWVNWAAAAVFLGFVAMLSALNTTSESPSLLSSLNPFETVRDFTLDSYTPPPTPLSDPVFLLPETKPVSVEVMANVSKDEILPEEDFKELIPVTDVKGEDSMPTPSLPKKLVEEVKTNHSYYLIAGSFGKLKNARDLKEQLLKKGFTESRIMDDTGGSLVKVSAGSFATLESAMLHKDKVDALTGADSWVYHRR